MSLMAEAENQNGELRAVETDPTDRFFGWVFYKHPDGQWVTLRKATDDEMRRAQNIVEAAKHFGRLAAASQT